MKTVKECWNEYSNNYYADAAANVERIKAEPKWAFPSVIYTMINNEFPSLKDKRVLVPSSGDNIAVFAFHLLGAKVTSADISENQLLSAKRISDDNKWDIEFICEDSMRLLAIQYEEYDLVYTSNGVHVWINDLAAMYRSFLRVLKPGGSYIMFETHPFIRPFGNDEVPVITVKKLYEDIDFSDDVPQFGWRIQDIFNAVIDSGFMITHMEEFHPGRDDHNLWFYRNRVAAEADDFRRFDWKQNPWAVMPQWIGFTAKKER